MELDKDLGDDVDLDAAIRSKEGGQTGQDWNGPDTRLTRKHGPKSKTRSCTAGALEQDGT